MDKFTHRYLSLDLTGFLPPKGYEAKNSSGSGAVEKFRKRLKGGKVGFYDWPQTIPSDLIGEINSDGSLSKEGKLHDILLILQILKIILP